MGIGTVIGKSIRFALRSPILDDTVIREARKTARVNAGQSKWNPFTKESAQAGWKTLKDEVKNTKTYSESFASSNTKKCLSKAKNIFKGQGSFGNKLKNLISGTWRAFKKSKIASGAVKLCKKAGKFCKMTGKVAAKLCKGKFKVVGKYLGKALKSSKAAIKGLVSVPVLGGIVAGLFELPGVIKSFKEGGFKKGMIHLGVSAAKVALISTVGAAVTAVAGPVAGAVVQSGLYMGMDHLQNKLMEKIPNEPEYQEAEQRKLQAGTNVDDTTAVESNLGKPEQQDKTRVSSVQTEQATQTETVSQQGSTATGSTASASTAGIDLMNIWKGSSTSLMTGLNNPFAFNQYTQNPMLGFGMPQMNPFLMNGFASPYQLNSNMLLSTLQFPTFGSITK